MLFLFELIVLALIQGVGEILPISSSAHLIMISNLFNINKEDLTIEILLHLASLFALIVYYYDFIKNIIKKVYLYLVKKDKTYYKEWGYFTTLIIASIPTCLVGFFINDHLNKVTNFVGLILIFNGLILMLIKDKYNEISIEDLSFMDKLKIGIIQCMGLIPGISRSGSSLFGCNHVKLNKEDSFNLTFLLLFPLVIGSFVLNVNDFKFESNLLIPYIIIFLITFMVTYLSMIILHNTLIKGKSKIFAIYCVAIGIIYSIIMLVI